MKHVSELATIDNTAQEPVAYVPGKADQMLLVAFATWRAAKVRYVPKFEDQHDSARVYASTLRDGGVHSAHGRDIQSAIQQVKQTASECPSAAEFLAIVRMGTHHRNMRKTAIDNQNLITQQRASDETVDREVAKFRQAMADYSKLGR